MRKIKIKYSTYVEQRNNMGVICDANVFDNTTEGTTWNLYYTSKSVSCGIVKYSPKVEQYDEETGCYIVQHKKPILVVNKAYNDGSGIYEEEYYTSHKYPWYIVMDKLTENGGFDETLATEYRNAVKEYQEAWSQVQSASDGYIIMPLVEDKYHREYNPLTKALRKLARAQDMLYKRNGTFRTLSYIDMPIKLAEARFNKEELIDKGLGESTLAPLSEEESLKLFRACAIYDIGSASSTTLEGHRVHPETYTFKDVYTLAETGIAEEADDIHPWKVYHEVREGQSYFMFTCTGRYVTTIHADRTDREVLECYDYLESLSEEDRSMFYKSWQDEYLAWHTVHNLSDFFDMVEHTIELRDRPGEINDTTSYDVDKNDRTAEDFEDDVYFDSTEEDEIENEIIESTEE